MPSKRKKILAKRASTKLLMVHTGMVFGVFDGLHEGHRYFLSEAARRCERLIVVLTLPETAEKLKGRTPRYSFAERAEALLAFNPALSIVPSDSALGAWNVLEAEHPDHVFLGYDQEALAQELMRKSIPATSLPAHFPERYKSGLLNAKIAQKEN